jgi:outer membrane autotransporter protein
MEGEHRQRESFAAHRALRWIAAAVWSLFAAAAVAAPPSFTGQSVRASGSNSIVNLRAQGALAGSAPVNVRVNAVRVGGVLSPLISIVRAVLQPGASASVCVEVQNLLGLDLTILGVEMDVTAFNADAPNGVSGRIVVRSGIGGEDISPGACADAVAAALPPTANAGPDQNLADTDGQLGEAVTLNGSASSDPDGTIVSYQWRNVANQTIATGVTPTVRLPDGRQSLTLVVTDDSGISAADTVNVSITAPSANQLPIAQAGADRIVADTDNQAGESVTLDGTQSTDPDGSIVSYEWLVGQSTVLATGAIATVRLPDGPQTLTLRVTDDAGGVGTDTTVITVAAANPTVAPSANAGADRVVADTDAQPGENVILDGSASTDTDGTIVGYQWSLGAQQIATGVNATARLPDGENYVTLTVTDDDGNTSSDAVLITIAAAGALAPVAAAGVDRAVADSDGSPGENVPLDASASSDADGTIVSYQWFLGGEEIAVGVNANPRLADGNHLVTLIVIDDDGNTASDTLQVAVAAPPLPSNLANLPGLTPNQRAVARTLDSLCPRLSARAAQQALQGDAADLLARCNGIIRSSSTAEQVRALDEISPQDLNATRTQSLNLSRSQLANIADRLIALRAGARGLSLAGLNLNVGGEYVPLAQIVESIDALLGGGASADDERGGLLDSRLGLWLRGNYSFGDKEGTLADHGFDAEQWGVIGGADFRVSPRHVVGAAFGYGRTGVDFNPSGSGDLDTRAMTAALYATTYSKRGFYIDAVVNYLRASYDSRRRIAFTEGGRLIDVTAAGDTVGATLGAAVTVGFDWSLHGFTIAPSLGYNYLGTGIDRFREHGAAGLDLAFQEQDYVSGTANAGLRLSYAWRTAIGVLQPQIRGEYIREFMDDTETFSVRFANDPFDDTPLMIIHTDVPDRSYWRLAAGLAAQFKHGISGFVEYQRLESLRYLNYADIALGLRFEASF